MTDELGPLGFSMGKSPLRGKGGEGGALGILRGSEGGRLVRSGMLGVQVSRLRDLTLVRALRIYQRCGKSLAETNLKSFGISLALGFVEFHLIVQVFTGSCELLFDWSGVSGPDP